MQFPIDPIVSACNQNCQCDRNAWFPMCHSPSGMSFISPCFAGCTKRTEGSDQFEHVSLYTDTREIPSFFVCLTHFMTLVIHFFLTPANHPPTPFVSSIDWAIVYFESQSKKKQFCSLIVNACTSASSESYTIWYTAPQRAAHVKRIIVAAHLLFSYGVLFCRDQLDNQHISFTSCSRPFFRFLLRFITS